MRDLSLCKMEFKKDENGRDILVKDGKFQVMMEWEKPYMEACIDALYRNNQKNWDLDKEEPTQSKTDSSGCFGMKPFGAVLEIGFGLGYSATRIQHYHPKSHTIIEYHPDVAAFARSFAEKHPHVTIVEDTWQNALPNLNVFDVIFFDDYPLYDEKEMIQMETQVQSTELLLQKGNQLIQDVHAQIPALTSMRYSDADLQGLIGHINPAHKSEVIQMLRFFHTLQQQGQITREQLTKQIHAFKGVISQDECDALLSSLEKKTDPFSGANDRLFSFLNQCLSRHMRKGSRFSCFLSDPTSKFEDPKFFNEIIVNPDLEYHEELIEIAVPQNCDYYHASKALVITITKMSD